jgi:glycosyltransferase involved in cell wall biosynthesis
VRILFVLEHFHPYIGGVETLFWELARSLTRQGYRLEVVTTRFRRDLPAEEELEGVRILRVRCYNRFLFSFLSLPTVIRRARQADLVQTTSYNAALPGWLGARLAGIPSVITFHEVWGRLWFDLPFIPLPLRYAYRMWEWLILRLPFDRVIAVSDATQAALLEAGLMAGRVRRIYNGLDYTPFAIAPSHPPASFVFTYFGRLGASKGLDLLIPAAASFLQNYPEARFRLIIPRYPAGMYRHIMDLVGAGHMGDQVELYHDLPRPQLIELIRSSSCVVIPSYSEGFCFVAAETTALGVPVISSERSALREVVGGRHLSIQPLTIEGIQAALEKALSGQWQMKPVTQFPLQEAVHQYILTYHSLIEGP